MFNQQTEGENELCSHLPIDDDESESDETPEEVYQDYLSPKRISSRRHGFVSIMITGVYIFIRWSIVLIGCVALFLLSWAFAKWFMNEGLEYLKYGHRLNFFERLGHGVSKWWTHQTKKIKLLLW